MWILIPVIFFLSACSHQPTSIPGTNGQFSNVFDDQNHVIAGYNYVTGEAIFYTSPEEAFKKLFRKIIDNQMQAQQSVVGPKEVKPTKKEK